MLASEQAGAVPPVPPPPPSPNVTSANGFQPGTPPGQFTRSVCSHCDGTMWINARGPHGAAAESSVGSSADERSRSDTNSPLECNAVASKAHVCGACRTYGPCFQRCGICFERKRFVRTACVDAAHRFCHGCIASVIKVNISDGVHQHRCPAVDADGCRCPNVIPERCIMWLLRLRYISDADAAQLEAMQSAARRERLRALCTAAIVSANSEAAVLELACATDAADAAAAAGKVDAAFARWAIRHLQSCPRCYVIVERSQGCAKMTCTCGEDFCYVCGDRWPCRRHHSSVGEPRLNAQGTVPATAAAAALETGESEPEAFGTHSAAQSADVGASANSSEDRGVESADTAKARILDMLTLKCPHCAAAFAMEESFSECFSLQCSSCNRPFCAWCLCHGHANPHEHVIDCASAPEDMRGHGLYLNDHNGGPHLPPNPYRKFERHWRNTLLARASSQLEKLAPQVRPQVEETLSRLAQEGAPSA